MTRTLQAALALALVIAFALESGRAAAAPDTIYIAPTVGFVGANATAQLQVSEISDAGLGAWTVDVTHNPEVVELASCTGQSGSLCGKEFGPETTRITGASEDGISLGADLATLTYRCLQQGSSPLTIDVVVFATADGGKVEPLEVLNGSIYCTNGDPPPDGTAPPAPTATTPPSLPPTGAGPTDDWGLLQWALAALTATGASLVALAVLRKDRV
ncbi:MAG: hypothetical protein WEB04_01110 [Dehalococcoidia bacterium]